MEVKSSLFSVCFFLTFFLSTIHFVLGGFSEEEEIRRSQFPDGFFFGTATSAYQIEGAYVEDGKSLNNWDVFNHRQGFIYGDNGDTADDHYHLYLEDIEIMRSMGVNAYRFSISWARVLPRGRFGEVNPAGISFYNKILDNILLKGIEPFVTIWHNDYPQELQDRYGAWLSPLMQEDFVHFAVTCFKAFGNRVKHWITINEPNLYSDMAYIRGNYPPARCSEPFGNCSAGNSDTEPLRAMHNMLLAHAKAVKIYRQHFQVTQPKQRGVIGLVVCAFMYEPFTDDEPGRKAVDRALAFNVAWALDPLVFGDYPPEMRRYLGDELPCFSTEEKSYIKGSIDYVGINHYGTLYAKDCLHSSCILGADRPIRGYVYTTGEQNGVPIGERTGMSKFFVVPRGMEEIVDYVKERFNKPIYVLENGYSSLREPHVQVEELVQDVKRIDFHKAYLSSLATAISRNGADVRGYFVWSLMDNYEWVAGYGIRFGLYYIDRQSLERIPKISARWYKSFLTSCNNHSDEVKGTTSFRSSNVKVPVLKTEQAAM
ncbi:Beta-glucosidase [Bertholletia excelsa]